MKTWIWITVGLVAVVGVFFVYRWYQQKKAEKGLQQRYKGLADATPGKTITLTAADREKIMDSVRAAMARQ